MDKKYQKANNASFIKDYIALFTIALIAMVVTGAVFVRLYTVSRQSIVNMWSSKTTIMASEVEQYLNVPKDAVLFASKGVEDMINAGATNEEIHQYLINQSLTYSNVIDSNSTGIYGYVNGEYLDSSGWTPPEGFDSLERPWYQDAVKANGEIAFVQPYINVQTDTLMMSVSKLLEDKKSVLSMDIYLDTLQKLCKGISKEGDMDVAMVIDSEGLVVAHNNKMEVGKNYLENGNAFQKSLLNGIQTGDDVLFLFDGGTPKTVFVKRLNNEWDIVFIFTDRLLFGSVMLVYVNSGVVLIAVFSALMYSLKLFRKRHSESKRLQSELAAVADIYLSLSILDLKELKLNRMWVSERLTEILSTGNFSLTRVDEIVKAIAAEPSRNMLEQFMDFSTVAERLKNTKSISHDFLDIDNHWTRMHFIAGYRDEDGVLQKVIWATESIDEDKRRQEELREKAENDALTRILNRRGGESRIFEEFENGTKGMFLILDADHFKHVNDTYGHDVGDQVIISIANCLTETFRDSDVVFRLGGDEFAVYVSGVDSMGIAQIVAGRLFDNVEKVSIPGVTDWKLCISVGATFCDPEKDSALDEYFKQADSAMYDSKQVEGNKITFYSDKENNENEKKST